VSVVSGIWRRFPAGLKWTRMKKKKFTVSYPGGKRKYPVIPPNFMDEEFLGLKIPI
jgi:hypothetical protein